MSACLEITTVSHCKNVCSYCPQALLLTKYGKKEFMKIGDFIECINKVPNEVDITFAGYAEPFLNPEACNMMWYAWNKGHKVNLYTTLVGLSKHDISVIQSIKFNTVQLHLPDAWGQMKADVGDEYIANAKYFLDRIPVNGSHVYGPLHDKLIDLFPGAQRRNLDKDLHTRANNVKQEKIAVKHEEFKSGNIQCDVVLRRGGQSQLDFNVLMPNGDIQICCMDYGLQHKFGNLLTDSYESLFESEAYLYVQRALKDDTLPLLCRTCKEAKSV
jgi:sulfatase maturation enzyme AslB (radical SAM superfamily)